MKVNAALCGFALGALLVTSAAQATMIGDVLTFSRAYPTSGTSFGLATPVSTTVTADSSDSVQLQENPAHLGTYYWGIDPGSSNIYVDVLQTAVMVGVTGVVFDGIVFSGFSGTLASVSYTASNSAFVADLNLVGNTIELSLTGTLSGSDWINIAVVESSSGAPDSGTTVALVGGVLLGLAAFRRKKTRG